MKQGLLYQNFCKQIGLFVQNNNVTKENYYNVIESYNFNNQRSLLFVILVSAFAITSTLLITVVRKTKEIGLLGAMGATPPGLVACFTMQGFIIGVAGTSFGILFALLALAYRNQIVGFVAGLFNKEETLVRFYQFTHLPADLQRDDFVIIIIAAIVVSTLAGLIPAFRASSRHISAVRPGSGMFSVR